MSCDILMDIENFWGGKTKMALILVVDDEKEIAQLLDVCLKSEGFDTVVCYTMQQAMQIIAQGKIDLAILDVMLPDGDGFSLCREIRKKYFYPVIMLTARDSDADKIGGLGLGADDYVTKPFQPAELMARVHAQLRRYIRYNQVRDTAAEPESGELYFNGLSLNPQSHTCMLNGQKLPLTPTEFTILQMLMAQPGRVFSAEELFHGVWGDEYWTRNNNTIATHIRHLREKMQDTGERPLYIRTVWGIGYRLGEG